MGGETVEAGRKILVQSGIPTYEYPDTAAHVFTLLWRSTYNLRALYETPDPPAETESTAHARDRAEAIVAAVRREGRTILTEIESKQILESYAIPTVKAMMSETPESAVAAAEAIGYPVVVKLHSTTITHKSEVGGVQLNLNDASAVRSAFHAVESSVGAQAGPGHFQGVSVQPMVNLDGYEIIVGSSLDPQFGPVLLFGLGGRLAEVFKDRGLGLPPLNTTLARRMMEQTKIFGALKHVRGRRRLDLTALEHLLVRFSHLVVEQRWIKEIEINPLLVAPDGLIALDARVIVHGLDVSTEALPRPAIRPYPTQYINGWTGKDETRAVIRPIRPEDELLLAKFHSTLSDRSVLLRYFHAMKLSTRVAHERLTRICFIDYDREMALVAERNDPETGEKEIMGVGRLSKVLGTRHAEFALLVSDRFQGLGLGTELLRRLLDVGRNEAIEQIHGDILPENVQMQRICDKLGFDMSHDLRGSVIRAVTDLRG
jgi:acetyltransferase